MRYRWAMLESKSSSSADDNEALHLTQRLIECMGELQPIVAELRRRNALLDAAGTVPTSFNQHLLKAAISVVQHETVCMERILDEAPRAATLVERPKTTSLEPTLVAQLHDEITRLRRSNAEISRRESGLYNEIIEIAKEVNHPDPEACDLGSVLSLIRERKAVQP